MDYETNGCFNNTIENFHCQINFLADDLLSRQFHTSDHQLFNLDLKYNFAKGSSLSRAKRTSCPGGVGNFGFNSFNFMTFVLLTLNAVANTNNNINNNNNNNVDINYNTINQDSNNVVSNSENMNMVTATILPVPGRRSLNLLNKYYLHFHSKSLILRTLLDH